jgi:hypothetical protein
MTGRQAGRRARVLNFGDFGAKKQEIVGAGCDGVEDLHRDEGGSYYHILFFQY